MKPEEITVLAREYAEEKAQSDREQGFPESFIKDMAEFNEKEMKSVLEFLFHRYCLVEKSKLEEEYHEAKFTCGDVDPWSETFATRLAKKSMLERLFPNLGKEVES